MRAAGREGGGHRTEQRRLVPQHGQVRQRRPAVGHREGQIEQHPARVMASATLDSRRHGSDSALVSPVASAISASSRVPAWAATDNVGRLRLRFTLEVPFSLVFLLFRNHKFPKAEGLFHAYAPDVRRLLTKQAG
jgi:hypothetical protein